MSTESDKGIVRCYIVRCYFEEALDKRNLDVLDEIIATDCIIHRPEASEPIRGLEAFKQGLKRILDVYGEFTTTIHGLIAEEDRVACRLSHRAVNRSEWTSRLGQARGSRKNSQLASYRHLHIPRGKDCGRIGLPR